MTVFNEEGTHRKKELMGIVRMNSLAADVFLYPQCSLEVKAEHC